MPVPTITLSSLMTWMRYAFLAHLSKENNYPQLAFEAVKCQLWEEMGLKDLDFDLSVAKRDEPSKMVVL